jgi:hypothetical protein
MFESKNAFYYVFAIGIVFVTSFLANKVKTNLNDDDEDAMIKKYLLNESPLYGFNRPKIWIHTKYEVNARKWKSFYSRNSTDLNQPYIHLTIKTIINHCGDDFNICLIDDETFSKLIPSWDIDLSTVAEPMKTHIRQIGLVSLVYYYGGMVVPNSFLCIKNLKGLYQEGIANNCAFVCENVNHTLNLAKHPQKMLFSPDLSFFGATKNDPTMKLLMDYLKTRTQNPHFTSEIEFLGDTTEWCSLAIRDQKMNLIGGELIGVKTKKNKPILVDDLMEENFLDLNTATYGIYIPEDEILKRVRYQWFSVMSTQQLLDTNIILSKYLKASIVDSTSEYTRSTEKRSVTAI